MNSKSSEVGGFESYGSRPVSLPDAAAIVNDFHQETFRLMTPDQIEHSAINGAKLMAQVFGLNETSVYENLKKDFCAITAGYNGEPDVLITAIPGLVLGEEGGDWISPSQLIEARNNALSSNGLPTMGVVKEVYLEGRSADWWNKTTPDHAASKIGQAGLQGLVVFNELKGTGMGWECQQSELAYISKAASNDVVAIGGLSIANWNVWDQLAVANGYDRQDSLTCRFVQHERDVIGFGGPHGPGAVVRDGRAILSKSIRRPFPRGGFRIAAGKVKA
ncbi:hypothetical protein HZB74_03145 [Candidatus Saccharibacteria bacterium]|nr:hypothetical protein [Candidatus Saccharibacteria bacterium]